MPSDYTETTAKGSNKHKLKKDKRRKWGNTTVFYRSSSFKMLYYHHFLATYLSIRS